jgi:hypothetical protein
MYTSTSRKEFIFRFKVKRFDKTYLLWFGLLHQIFLIITVQWEKTTGRPQGHIIGVAILPILPGVKVTIESLLWVVEVSESDVRKTNYYNVDSHLRWLGVFRLFSGTLKPTSGQEGQYRMRFPGGRCVRMLSTLKACPRGMVMTISLQIHTTRRNVA